MNLSPSDELLAKSCRFNLRRVVHALNPGNTLGDQTGGSLIFQDHRLYAPGDDIRRIDWRAYGRTDQLMLKTYQEEIAPYLEVLVDVSASMAIVPAKQDAVRRWTWFLTTVGLHCGYTVSVTRLGLDPAPLRPEELEHLPWQFGPAQQVPDTIQRNWKGRYRALRVIISDFLFDPGAIERVLATTARDAIALFGLQLLEPDEIDPPWRGPYRLVDDDQSGREELVISDREVAQYKERLATHQASIRTGFRRRGGAFAVVNTAAPAKQIVMNALVPAGILELG